MPVSDPQTRRATVAAAHRARRRASNLDLAGPCGLDGGCDNRNQKGRREADGVRQPNLKSLQLRHQRGQVLILVAIALPVFLAFTMLVIDGSLGYVKKRQTQNAADAAALAAAREVTPALGSCNPACMAAVQSSVAAVATDYSGANGWSGSALPECAQPTDTNCYTWPYKGSNGKVEVR